MSTFLTGKALEKEIDKIIWDAEEILLIVSPYIKLDTHFKELFEKHSHNHNLKIVLVFGKNEKKVSKSLSKQDFEFFKQFPDISIIHAPQLHGKYYGNEKKGVITSINLYDYSFTNENIEFGVFTEQSNIGSFKLRSNNVDNDAFNKCMDVADEGQVVFINRPLYRTDKGLFTSSSTYIKSETLLDETEHYYGFFKKARTTKKLSDFPDELDIDSNDYKRPERKSKKEIAKVESLPKFIKKDTKKGFCIRTGEEIAFNPERPFCYKAYKSWAAFENYEFPEKYCHKTGEASNGKTSMANPILQA
ncbi:hypothetical protein DFQ09_103328 [Winogradskyella pacifica]|uniref:Phospholipase D-like protein n=1 Tax=Winogradskyella pacifica TaxID=664642 RepID=A0A3D9N4P1_9FLAO|nr:phospholipase D family protein [Winogradskyella pacifica]REE25021.1 hypothetical protein DFQ09_103328 [Winogradskyella pacifica]